jgi:hypothetical protein
VCEERASIGGKTVKKHLKLWLLFGFARDLGITTSFYVMPHSSDPIVTVSFDWPGGHWQCGRCLSQWNDSISYLTDEITRIVAEQTAAKQAKFNEESALLKARTEAQQKTILDFDSRQLALFSGLGVGSDSECRNREKQQENQQNQGQNASQIEP